MSTAEHAVLVNALTLGDTNARWRSTAASTTIRCDAGVASAACFRTRARRARRTEGITSAHVFALCRSEAETVRVGIAHAVRESNGAVAGTGAVPVDLGQRQARDCTGECYASDCAANAAQSCTASDLLVSQGFGDVFEPVCHRHLLVDCVGGISAVLQYSVPQRTELASSIQK